MILQALNQYYQRLKDNPNVDIPPFGFSEEKISFALVINEHGELLQIRDLRKQGSKNKFIPRLMNVPEAINRTSGKKSNFMWDNTKYVLGAGIEEDKSELLECFKLFKQLHHEIGGRIVDDGMNAVLRFIDSWEPDNAYSLPGWEEIVGKNLVFQLDGRKQFIHDSPEVKNSWLEYRKLKTSSFIATCLISGEKSPIAQLHPAIGGFKDQVRVVSFNEDSFISFNKEQSFNAPVSEVAVFNYTTILNYLLRFDSPQKVTIADTTIVFWAEQESLVEGFLGMIFDPRDDVGESADIKLFLEAVREGKLPLGIDGLNKFYILGLSPNASRLAVRFWYVSTVEDIASKIGQHFQDLKIVRSFDNDKEFPGIWWLLKETVRDSKDIPPLLAGAVMRSILMGAPYPQTLLSSVIGRIRADGVVNYYRAAIIKACLVRKYRIKNQPLEVSMGLNKDSTNVAYRLGRLFAVLEKAQEDAIPGTNTTIKDRYYGSASATPKVVFPLLLRLAQHHIKKSDYGFRSDKLIEEITQTIQEFPAHLPLDEQGFFALGYYHQRKDFYTKVEKQEVSNV